MLIKKIFCLLLLMLAQCFSLWAFIYEINPRQFSEDNAPFIHAKSYLPHLKELGVTTLWVMPIYKIGEEKKKGLLGSPYSIADYKSFNTQNGDEEDFKRFVDEAHRLGMEVILDWVANHTSWDHSWTREHPDYYMKRDGHFIPPLGEDWEDVIQLDYGNPALRKAMLSEMRYWIEAFQVDGFRLDAAYRLPVEFVDTIKQNITTWRQKRPYLLCETDHLEYNNVCDSIYSWSLFEYAKHPTLAYNLRDMIRKEGGHFRGSRFSRMLSDHDKNSWEGTPYGLFKDEEAVRLYSVIQMTLPGKPIFYNGEEIGLSERLPFFEKSPINWRKHNRTMEEHYKKLLKLRRWRSSFLETASLTIIDTHSDHEIVAYRRGDNNEMAVIVNTSPYAKTFYFKNTHIEGSFCDFLTQERVEYGPHGDANWSMTLPGLGYKILINQKSDLCLSSVEDRWRKGPASKKESSIWEAWPFSQFNDCWRC